MPKSPDEIKPEQIKAFLEGVEKLVNVNSLEQYCDIPDFIIASYLLRSFYSLCCATQGIIDWDMIVVHEGEQ